MTEPTTQAQPPNQHGGKDAILQPYEVECGDDRGRIISFDHMMMRLRGKWSRSMFPGRDLGSVMNKMPDTPGIRIAVTPRANKIRIYDPLTEDKKLLLEINNAASGGDAVRLKSIFQTYGPWDTLEYDLDDDKLASVMLEIARKVYGPMPCMCAVPGSRPPNEQQIVAGQKSGLLKGRELYDPWNSSAQKPRYVDQVSAFADKWERLAILGAAAGSV